MRLLKEGSIDYQQILDNMWKRFNAQCKVSKPRVDRVEFDNMVKFINYINNIPYNEDTFVDNRGRHCEVSDIKIPKCFDIFVKPSRLVVYGNDRYEDMKIEEVFAENCMNKQNIVDFSYNLYNALKLEPQMVNINRKVETLNDSNRWSVVIKDQLCSLKPVTTVPSIVKPEVALIIGHRHFIYEVDYDITDLLDNFKF